MADKKITQLGAIPTVELTDVVPIVDLTDGVTKKGSIQQIIEKSPVQSVASKTGAVTLNKSDVGLSNVDNTSDANKPVSTATQTALNAKQDTLVSGTNIKTINSTSILGSGDIAVSASPSGGAGLIQFSDGSAFASDSNFVWDNTNKRLGIGTPAPSARLHITGSGSTSATTALLVQNSAGSAALTIADDRAITTGSSLFVGFNINADRAISQGGSSPLINNTSFNSIQSYPRFGLTSDVSVFLYQASFVPTTGSGAFAVFNATPTINQTGGASGITRGLYVNPTLTSAADFRAIETTDGKIIFGNLPTSSSGLVSGQLWNDSGTLKIA